MERFCSLDESWVSSFQPVLPPVGRPSVPSTGNDAQRRIGVKRRSLWADRGFLRPLWLSRQHQTGFYAEHLVVREQPPAPVRFLVLGLGRNGDRDKVLHPVLLQPAISYHYPQVVPRPPNVMGLRNPQDDPGLVHPDFTVTVVEFRLAPLEQDDIHSGLMPEPTHPVLGVCGILEHVDGSTAHHDVRRLSDFQVKLCPDHPRKVSPLTAWDYRPVERRERDILVELRVAGATPSLRAVHDQRLVCVRCVRLAIIMAPSESLGRGEVAHRVGEVLRRAPQLDYLGRLHGALRKTFCVGPHEGRIKVGGDRRDENGLRKESGLQVGLRPRDEVREFFDRYRERDALLALGYAVQDADDLLCLAVDHYAPASAAAHATFLVAERKQTLAGLADELAVPVNQPPFWVPVERVGVDVNFRAVLQIVGVEGRAMEALDGMPHLVDGKVVSRGVLQRAAPDKVYVLRPCIVRVGIDVAVRREHPLDTDILAHDLSHVIVCAHEEAVRVQAKPRGELDGERGEMLDVGLEIRNRKDDVLGNEFLSARREGKRREQADEEEIISHGADPFTELIGTVCCFLS
jgi:hypothetical protein